MNNTLLSLTQPSLLLAVIIIVVTVWQLFWKGIALWRAATLKQRNWFIVLFVFIPLNDLGILELIYLFRFSTKRLTIKEVKSWFKRR